MSNPDSQQDAQPLTPLAASKLWFYPGENLPEGEMRITLMGTGWGNVVGPAQKGPSIFVELGNENKDTFVFDVGPGCILNYNAMGIPMSRMNRVFISHLHMDHCSDLPFIYAFGPNLGDRFVPLEIYGPSGPPLLDENGAPTDTTLGIKNMIEGMKQFTQWHTTSFKTMSKGSEDSYDLEHHVREFDYRKCGGIALNLGKSGIDHDHVVIKHFPAVHIIDGAVSYRLEWSPKGREDYIVFVYSGDTLPNDFMLEYGKNADIMIHETAPSISSVMNGVGVEASDAFDIVCNSHTPANSLGSILAKTKPKLGVTTHSPVDPRSIEELIMGVQEGMNKHLDNDEEKPAYQVGADLMVFSLSKDSETDESTITTRMSALTDRPWPVRIASTDPDIPAPLADQIKKYRLGLSKSKDDSELDGVNIFEQVNEAPQCAAYFAQEEGETKEEFIAKSIIRYKKDNK
ncbi:MAG: MBL fold metallo-hydrolase [Crocinitomicaceae bacterium]